MTTTSERSTGTTIGKGPSTSDQVLDVLEACWREGWHPSILEVAARLGWPGARTDRRVRQLARRGLVRRSRKNHLQPGNALERAAHPRSGVLGP